MNRIKRTVSPTEISLSLKESGRILEEKTKKGIPSSEIARELEYLCPELHILYKTSKEDTRKIILENLNKAFAAPLHPTDSKAGRALSHQIPNNNFFGREELFVDNMLIRDINKYLKNSNCSSRIIGCADNKLSLELKSSEKNQIVNFISAWLTQFGPQAGVRLTCEDLNLRKPCAPVPEDYNFLIRKEKITSMFL